MEIPNEIKKLIEAKINATIKKAGNHRQKVNHFNCLKHRIQNNQHLTVKMKENLCYIMEDISSNLI